MKSTDQTHNIAPEAQSAKPDAGMAESFVGFVDPTKPYSSLDVSITMDYLLGLSRTLAVALDGQKADTDFYPNVEGLTETAWLVYTLAQSVNARLARREVCDG